jgi:ABC-type iron transport system FetAB permease component
MTSDSSDNLALRIASLATAINVIVAGGFSIAGLLSASAILPAGASPTVAWQIFAMYAAARAVPLTLITLATLGRRSWYCRWERLPESCSYLMPALVSSSETSARQ